MPSPERIKYVVQNTLGCSCPEETFPSIDLHRNVRLNSFIVLDSAITVGNRLLVHITEAGTAGCIEEHLPILVNTGEKERDDKGLNRFRLALVADEPREVRQTAVRLFEKLCGTDEKVHLQVIDRSDTPFNT
jgi:hypothetical protein